MKFSPFATTSLLLFLAASVGAEDTCGTRGYDLKTGDVVIGRVEIYDTITNELAIDVEITGDLTNTANDVGSPTVITELKITTRCEDTAIPPVEQTTQYPDGITSTTINIAEASCGVGNKVHVDVEAKVLKRSAIDAVNTYFPVDVKYKVFKDTTNQVSDDPDERGSYWQTVFSTDASTPAGLQGLSIEGYCVDVDHTINTNKWYYGRALSYLEEDFEGTNIDTPGNLFKVAWLINNFEPGTTYNYDGTTTNTDSNPTYVTTSFRTTPYKMTAGTMQRAIWYIIDTSPSTAGIGTYSDKWARYLRDKALAQTSYEPGCDDLIPIVLIPDGGNNQHTIAQTTFTSLKMPCQEDKATSAAYAFCEPTVRTPPPPGTYGDPHFLTWGGETFDFMGADCDLVLAEAKSFGNGLGMTAHVRLRSRFDYSYIESAAVQIGEDVLEVGAFGSYMLNGISNAELPFEMANKYTITKTVKNDHDVTFDIQVNKHDRVLVKAFKDLVSVRFVGAEEAEFKDVVGVMGSFHDGKRLARDGHSIIQDDNEFGQEWQVSASDHELFQTKSSVAYPAQKCVLPSTVKDGRRRLGESISVEVATEACSKQFGTKGAVDACVYDVIATGELDSAQAGAI